MKYLFVVAHPDDEVLGAGAFINKLILEGNNVAVAFMCYDVVARNNLSATLKDDQIDSAKILGINQFYYANFPNIKMNTVPHLELVQFIEKCIEDFQAEVVVTHHPSDVNNDHYQTSIACQAAIRLFQRREDIAKLKEFMYMEVLSSSEWALQNSSIKFNPNYFVEIGLLHLDVKLNALSAYRGVMRKFPHPRSEEAIRGLAAYRGAQSGCNYAEAFECVFRRE